MSHSVYYLLKERRFLPLFLTQFCGAFNDNAFKLSMLTLISYSLSASQGQSEKYQAIAGALFILPFFLFSATSGQLADKFDKAKMARFVKLFELILMSLGGYALYHGNIFLLMLTLTGMGTHSTFFGPIKYAILPDHLPRSILLGATGLIEASTFLAILLGTTLGTLAVGGGKVYIAISLTIGVAFLGLLASFFIPKAPSSSTDLTIDWHVWRATKDMLGQVCKHPYLLVPILTISWFWLIGAVLLTKLPDYTHYVLNADNKVFAVFLALFSIGIAFGSMLINRLLAGKITLVYVPAVMMILSVFAFDLYWASPSVEQSSELLNLGLFFMTPNHWRIAFDLFMLSVAAGLFVVPLYTYLQVCSPMEARARTIATNNIYNALFMVLGSVLVMALLYLHVGIPQVFLVISILNAIVAVLSWFLLRKYGRVEK